MREEDSYHICTKHYRVVLEYIHFIYKTLYTRHRNHFLHVKSVRVCVCSVLLSVSKRIVS